jgi:alpha-glucosidase
LVQDPFEKNVPGLGLGRDPERSPMQWDASANAGFSPAGAHPWLPVAHNFGTVNVESELDDSSSTLNFVRRLLELRSSTPALHSGTYRSIAVEDADCYVYRREAEGHPIVVALNFSAGSKTISVPDYGRGLVRVSTHSIEDSGVDLQALHLRPNEGCVVEVHSG